MNSRNNNLSHGGLILRHMIIRPNMKYPGIGFLAAILVFLTATSALATRDAAKEALETAWENLKIAQATELRIAAKLKALRESGNVSPEILKDYETYLKNVQLMVLENQRIVQHMEVAYTGKSDISIITGDSDMEPSPEIRIPEENKVDRVAQLDQELDDSLAAFDEMLLKRLELIRAESADKMTDWAMDAADAANRAKENQGKSEDGAEKNIGTSRGSESGEEKSTETGNKRNGTTDTSGSGRHSKASSPEETGRGQDAKRPGKEGDTRDGDDRSTYADKDDDDIVARQLREAAENETDPELKKKLWEKYDEYKKSTR